ncbi:hypothetical protein [Sinorhizobium sp. BJ1]|uniref:hypothetical protein n=1 Tax=Sinorhizobium sp. BJ1 TaxID=2035455 RepID=UPI000BE7A259|nr:hypothetical protein [Sinorhizobium sp. BJ1]PDT86522.1 hypothetical protein CO676_02205 [Sinorhizobium sp. BJ1]
MTKRRLTLSGANNNAPYRATSRPQLPAAPLLTIDRAIADELCPTSLRQVADANLRSARKGESSARLLRQADNLLKIADKLELLGYRRAA